MQKWYLFNENARIKNRKRIMKDTINFGKARDKQGGSLKKEYKKWNH